MDKIRGKECTYQLNYSKDFQPRKVTTGVSFNKLIKSDFIKNNRGALFLSAYLSTGTILFVMNLLLIGGVSFFLWLTKKSGFSSIASFKESVSMILLSFGGGTVISVGIGFFDFDMIVMLGLQSLSMIVMLLICYLKTRFKDKKDGGLMNETFGNLSSS